MAHPRGGDSRNQDEHSNDAQELVPQPNASSAPVLISGVNEDDASDTEQTAGLLDDHANSAPQPSWRDLASLSLSALSGDTIWHQARADRNR